MFKKRGEKYDLIVDAAVKVFAQKGFDNSRVSDVAQKAGVADGTIYLYFARKEDILVSLVEDKMASFTDTLEKKLALASDSMEKLKVLVQWHLCYLGQDRDLAVVTQFEIRQSNPEIRSVLVGPMRKYFSSMEQVLTDGQADGSFTREGDVSLLRKVLFGTLDEVVTRWVLSQKSQYDLESMIEPVYKILKKALQA